MTIGIGCSVVKGTLGECSIVNIQSSACIVGMYCPSFFLLSVS